LFYFSNFEFFREELFKDCGEIVDIRLHLDEEGRFRGFGHVEFATEEAVLKVSCHLVWCVQIVYNCWKVLTDGCTFESDSYLYFSRIKK